MERRGLLTGMAATAAGMALLARPAAAQPATMNMASIDTTAEYGAAVAGPASLSLATSQLAMQKASNVKVKTFATFEHNEQNAIAFVLKDLGIPTPTMTPAEQLTLTQSRDTPAGAAFDRAYIAKQIETHEMLRQLHTAYLSNTTGKANPPMEAHGRHIATLALATINEHLTIAQSIMPEL